MKVRGSYASPLSSDGGDTLPDNPPHPPRRITYQSPGNADPFAKAQKFPYDASHRRKHHAIRKPSSAGSDVRTISDHSPQTSTKHMLPAAWNPVAYNTGRGPRPETQQRIPKGLSQPRRRDQGPTSITPVSPVGLYDPTTNPKQTSPDVPPKVPEVPRLPTPDLEWPDEDGTCFCSCCPSPAEDKWHNRQDATDTDAKLTAQREYH